MCGPFSSRYPTQLSSVQEDDSSSLKSYKVCVFKEHVARALQMAYKSQHV